MTRSEEQKALGQVIRALRELEGLTRAELGDRAELGPDMIAKVEQGAKAPSTSALRRIASALGVTPIELSDRGLIWSTLRANSEASTALLRSVATGTFRAGAPFNYLGAGAMVGAAGGAIAGAVRRSGERDRARVEESLRELLDQRLAEAQTVEELDEIAQAIKGTSGADD